MSETIWMWLFFATLPLMLLAAILGLSRLQRLWRREREYEATRWEVLTAVAVKWDDAPSRAAAEKLGAGRGVGEYEISGLLIFLADPSHKPVFGRPEIAVRSPGGSGYSWIRPETGPPGWTVLRSSCRSLD